MTCLGTDSDGTISIKGTYVAPPGPDWVWKIEITPSPFRSMHTNIYPEGKEELAAEGVYS